MIKLPYHWRYTDHTVCDPICRHGVTAGKSWRITVLTGSLLRLEYSPAGIFEDRATQFALNRNFPPCTFHVEDRPAELVISTGALQLRYNKKPFSKNGLCISLRRNSDAKASIWRFSDKTENLGGTIRTLDGVDGAAALEPGILSRKGIAVVDDSKTLALGLDGWLYPRSEGAVDIYVFAYGRDYRSCLKDFYHLTGPAPLLPRYALGNWWSRFHRYTEQSYKELIERFEHEQIPFSVSVIDMDWHYTDIDPDLGSGWTGFTWNRQLFPDPASFLAWLHQKKMRVTLNLHPADGIRAHEEAYSRIAKRLGVDEKSREPVVFDASNPEFLQAYFEEVLHPMEEEGVDFWWVDWQQGESCGIQGLDPLWVLNHFHYLDSRRRSKRALTFSRYAGLGSHRYPVGFSGDTIVTWQSLDFQPYFTASASNAGYGWWSHDIGGHMGGIHDEELAVRWVQFGVFSPINRLHSSSCPFNSKEPWRFNTIARNIMTEFLRLRHRLVPYLYTMNRRASREGEPLIQPMYYAEPENDEAYRVPNEYYFGSELICCPLTRPLNRKTQTASFKAWLPPGLWIDFFNGCIYSGGRLLELWRSLDTMPVLAKAGGIIPMAKMDSFTNSVENPAALELFVFAGADGSFRLWEDAGITRGGTCGDTRDDKDESWAATDFTLDWSHGQFTIAPAAGNTAAIPTARSWNLHFCGFAETGIKLTVEGRQIPAEPVYGRKLKRLSLLIPPTPVCAEICVNFEKAQLACNDVLGMLFDFLDKAWIEYKTKRQVFDMVKNSDSPASALAALKTLDLTKAVFSGICEILCAYAGFFTNNTTCLNARLRKTS